jgi:hypothetical protein
MNQPKKLTYIPVQQALAHGTAAHAISRVAKSNAVQ